MPWKQNNYLVLTNMDLPLCDIILRSIAIYMSIFSVMCTFLKACLIHLLKD